MLKISQIEIYEGIWDANFLDKYGRHIDREGNMYEGEYSQGIR
jgi:hypothetical protein